MAITKIKSPELFDFSDLNTALQLPTGTTAERPAAPSTGEWRYNTTLKYVEYYDGGAWRQIDTEFVAPTPSENFNTLVYAGSGGTQSITGVGFTPDLIWIKQLNNSRDHCVQDTIRGIGSLGGAKIIYPNTTDQESTNADTAYFQSFDSDGFTLGGNVYYNGSANTYVAWCWKASATEVTNNEGTTPSTVRANQQAGFSMCLFAVTNTSIQVGHGLSVAPEMIWYKNLSQGDNWYVYHKDLASPNTQYVYLNLTNSVATNATYNFSSVTNTTFTTHLTTGSDNIMCYCFHSVSGYSKVGSYVGTGLDTGKGAIVNTGFEPAWLMIKRRDSAGGWRIQDNKRLSPGFAKDVLEANDSAQEQTDYVDIAFFTNGFQVEATSGDYNSSGQTYLYYAIAADASDAPALADSFDTTLYTGNDASQTIGGHLNGSAQFNGSSSMIEISSSAINPANVYSVSMWFNTSSASTYTGLFTNNTNPMRVGEICIMKPNASAIQIFSANQAGVNLLDALTATSPEPFQDDTWYHVVVTSDRSISNQRAKVFINGQECAYTAYGASQASVSMYSNTRIGSADNQYFGGNIDQVRIFSGSLTDSQVRELYKETKTTANTLNFPTGAGCVAAYPLDSNSNDLSTNYNGTDTSITYTEIDLTPAWTWIKRRSNTEDHALFDRVRGVQRQISTNQTTAGYTTTNAISNFFNSGWNTGNNGATNRSPETYVSWNWKAQKHSTISTETADLASIINPNVNAGFSMARWVGQEQAGQTVAHGLGGTPELAFIKQLDGGRDWTVPLFTRTSGDYLYLNSSFQEQNDTSNWSAVTSTLMTVGASPYTNGAGSPTIGYFFRSISGYQKIGVYTGNDTTSNTIYTTDDGTSGGANGFEPGWLLIKRVDVAANWRILDNTRSTSNPRNKELYPNLNNAEGTFSAANFNSTSFEIITTDASYNALNGEYLYLVIK